MEKSCGLCVDNAAGHTLEIQTNVGTTGVVHICWPCLQVRVRKLMHDLEPGRDPHDDNDQLGGGLTGFTVTTP
jgi:hypothetical protein